MRAKYINETQVLFDYLQNNTATATMVTAATGIVQKSICRYKRNLEKMGLLYIIEVGPCSITGLPAQYLTTNPFLFPRVDKKQLTLWGGACNE